MDINLYSVPHPAATWLDPVSGDSIPQQTLLTRHLADKEVILLGERHDVAEIHRWQLHLTAMLFAHRCDIAVGFEMFPRRLQAVLDDWVAGSYTTAAFLKACEWEHVWRFDSDLYLPLFHFCRQFRIPMIALNCRRSLVSEVGQVGWEAIKEGDRDGLTPSAPATDDYRRYLFGIVGPVRGATNAMDSRFDRFVRAQQTWDRAFACHIAHGLQKTAKLIIGIIGAGHLEYGFGTPYQLKDLGVEKTAVLLTNDKDILNLENGRRRADAIFRIDTPDSESLRLNISDSSQ